MKRFDPSEIKEGDIICGRNNVSAEGRGIRALLGSETNHNALVVLHSLRGLGIGDMFPPAGVWVPFKHYEDLVDSGNYEIHILRINDATDEERHAMSEMWEAHVEGVPYSSWHVKRLWVYRFVNSMPYTMHGTWCTRAVGIVCRCTFEQERNIFRKIHEVGHPLKKNETPRTVENRLMQGLVRDVTSEVFHG